MKNASWMIVMLLSICVSLAVAADAPAPSPATPQVAGKPADVLYPFTAEAIGNDVYVRSGRGPGYYHCGKINTGDKVTVVEDSGGWAKILPLAENYSWIHKNYIKLNPQTPKIATVTGDNVRVWAGSDFIEPLRSNIMQARLNTGEIVELFDTAAAAETGDYYKIKAPSGAYLWVSSEFLKYVGPVKPVEPVILPQPTSDSNLSLEEKLGVEATEPGVAETTPPAPPEAVEPQPVIEPVKPEPPKPLPPSQETLLKQQCLELSEKLTEEAKKPIDAQDYSAYRQQLNTILADPEAGKAVLYADALVKRVDRYELVLGVTQTLKNQDDQLAKTREQIEKAHQAQLKKIPAVTLMSLYTGIVKPSSVYQGIGGKKRFLLVDNAGRILCYLLPAGPEIEGRLQQLIGQEINAQGTILSDPETLVTLLSVTSIPPKME